MDDLIEALQIMRTVNNPKYPTICEHDCLYITDYISPDSFTKEQIARLEELGFFISEEYGSRQFMSYRFGSA